MSAAAAAATTSIRWRAATSPSARVIWRTPAALYRAQSFPDSYVIDLEYNGKPLSKEAQVRMCGNSVPPVMARELVRANIADLAGERAA